MSVDPAIWLVAVLGITPVGLVLARRRATRARWRRLVRTPRRATGRRGRWRARPVRPRHGRGRVAAVGVGCGVLGLVLGGPVGAGVGIAYGTTGAVVARSYRRQRMEAASRRSAVDAVAGLAAELRAGSPVDAALTAASPALRPPQAVGDAALAVARRVAAAVEVAESSGAPLADVLDRLDSHLRAVDRGRAAAVAQAAGARASSLMLACMPVVGLGLGIAVGIDPFDVLLHSALGAACLAGAVVLQLCGLAWSARLSRLEAST